MTTMSKRVWGGTQDIIIILNKRKSRSFDTLYRSSIISFREAFDIICNMLILEEEIYYRLFMTFSSFVTDSFQSCIKKDEIPIYQILNYLEVRLDGIECVVVWALRASLLLRLLGDRSRLEIGIRSNNELIFREIFLFCLFVEIILVNMEGISS